MVQLLLRDLSHHPRKYHTIFLAFLWVIGLTLGIRFASFAGDSLLSLMRGSAFGAVSIVNLLAVTLLPFLFSAFAVYIRSACFLAVLCFIKSFSFGFVSTGLVMAWGSAGWLIRLLFMFSDLICLVPLWWCWIRFPWDLPTSGFRPVIVSAGVAAGIVCLDYLCISPFLARLFEY